VSPRLHRLPLGQALGYPGAGAVTFALTNWSMVLPGQAAAHREEMTRRLVSSTLSWE
jgi:hypothetical protein